MTTSPKHAGVYIQPPFFGLACFGLAWLLQKYLPLSNIFWEQEVVRPLAVLLFIIALSLGLPAVYCFRKAGTTVATFKPARSLETGGLYRYSRNPMYLGLLMAYSGFCVWFGTWYLMASILLFFSILNFYVIPKEEHYLEVVFPKEYKKYREEVYRWLGRKDDSAF